MGYPAAIVTEPLRLVAPNSPWCDIIGYYMVAGTSKGLGAALGFAPFLIKKIFYDTPLWMFGNQTPEKPPVKPFKLPKELMTPIIPDNIGDVKNLGINIDDIIPDESSLELAPEKPREKIRYLEEEQVKKEKQLKKDQKKAETKQEIKEPVEVKKTEEKKVEKKPIEVSPNLPSWIHQEIGEK